MPTIPQVFTQSSPSIDEDAHELPSDHKMPGWTVDALLEQGKVDEARAELERLVEHGINSGKARPMDQTLFDEIIASARGRAGQSSL